MSETAAAVVEPTIEFLGGVGTVTGSRFLVRTGRSTVLVECGMYQGLKADRVADRGAFPFPPDEIDAVVITHAHIDHSGYLPALVARGLRCDVFCSDATADLCGVVLPDAAYIQEEQARHANERGFSKHEPALPLFTSADAQTALRLIRSVPFRTERRITADVSMELRPAGHILGSSTVLLRIAHPSGERRMLVSGDLGRRHHPILVEPDDPPAADLVLIESTYGDRRHADPAAEAESLATAISGCVADGGQVLIPAFAVDRTQVVLRLLGRLMDEERIPQLPVYADSPMALRVLDVYRRHGKLGAIDVRPGADLDNWDPGGGLTECPTVEDSMALASLRYPSIIISASGMATGGRVLHHLSRLIGDHRNLVVLAGFQAAGTRGRSLADGKATVKLHGRVFPVRARILQLESLSVHADSDELLDWVGRSPEEPAAVCVVHGEASRSEALAERIRDELGYVAFVPRRRERLIIG